MRGALLRCAAVSAPWPEPAAPAGLRERLAAAARAGGTPGLPCPSSKGTFQSPGNVEKHPRSRFFFFWPFLLWSLTGNMAVVEDVSHAYVAFINNECVLWIISFWRGTWEFRLTIRVSQLLLKWEFWLNQEICSPPQDVCAPDDIYTPLFALFYYADFLGLRCM